ncbi:MAG: ABC transporter ATP-binding protein [Candidatus Limnocylindrales bacterium]
MDLITAERLSKRYRRTWALRDVDLSLPQGGVTALVGPNGAGKSTLLKLCVGFERATGGRVLVLGTDPARERGAAIAKVGYVPQAPSLYRELTVLQHVQLAGTLRPGFDAPHAFARLRDLGIPLPSTPAELSGGQQAQVSLAIALGTRAPLLLLDEPLANLDPLARREFLQVVGEVARSGDVGVVLASHVISDVEPVADRLLVLGNGRVLLNEPVVAGLARHRVVDGDSPPGAGELVSRFPDRYGREFQLISRSRSGSSAAEPDSAHEPTLEELVVGYLASSRGGLA